VARDALGGGGESKPRGSSEGALKAIWGELEGSEAKLGEVSSIAVFALFFNPRARWDFSFNGGIFSGF